MKILSALLMFLPTIFPFKKKKKQHTKQLLLSPYMTVSFYSFKGERRAED